MKRVLAAAVLAAAVALPGCAAPGGSPPGGVAGTYYDYDTSTRCGIYGTCPSGPPRPFTPAEQYGGGF
jgi:hypothetical protein